MASERRSFKLGESVTVTAPEALVTTVADGAAAVVGHVLGGRSDVRRRSRRASSGERLSVDRIVDVAIAQMRERGYDAVTMRSIARELETGPASLYAHVANRAELDQLVVGRVCSQWHVPDPDPESWDTQLRQAMVDLLDLYRANPGVARCTLGMIPLDPGLLMVTERLVALLKAGEVSDRHAAWFVDVGSLFVASVAVEEDIWRERNADQGAVSEEAVVAHVREVFSQLPAEHYPWLHALAGTMTSGDPDDRFGFALDLLIGGLVSLGHRAR